LADLARTQPPEVLRAALAEALPWVTFLPGADVDQLLAELIVVAQGAASPTHLSPVAVLLTQWRHTAEVYADPVLLEILSREPEGDFGPRCASLVLTRRAAS
jgi:hypothetical protein